MTQTLHGTVRGKTIELDVDLGMADGQPVEIQVKLLPTTKKWGEGILRSAGGWSEHPELDAIMETVHQQRKVERRSPVEGE